MSYIQQLFTLMEEKLSAKQLETIQKFISEQRYKKDGRAPTLAEQEAVIAVIENALLEGRDDETGLEKLYKSGDINHFPDTDF